MLECGFEYHSGLEFSGFTTWHSLRNVISRVGLKYHSGLEFSGFTTWHSLKNVIGRVSLGTLVFSLPSLLNGFS